MHGTDDIAVTGITRINDRLVMMLDFESIFDAISMQKKLHIDRVENSMQVDRHSCRILIAEDSSFIRKRIRDVLVNSGYQHVECHTNGEDAWNALQASANDPQTSIHLIISDVEMPKMDGYALTRNIKSHPKLKSVPVLLFSSLITPDSLHKGRQVGADDQLAKPQLEELVGIADRWISSASDKAAA